MALTIEKSDAVKRLENEVREFYDSLHLDRITSICYDVYIDTELSSAELIMKRLLHMHSEISEAYESLREQDFDEFKREITDIFISLFDLTEGLNINFEEILLNKSAVKNKRKNREKMCLL